METHSNKKIMKSLCVEDDQMPGIRFEVAMDEIPEELQRQMEVELKEFERKSMDIVTTASETMQGRRVLFESYDIKKIVAGAHVDKKQKIGIRIVVVMDSIPEELQEKVESEIKKLKKKAVDIVAVIPEQCPINIRS